MKTRSTPRAGGMRGPGRRPAPPAGRPTVREMMTPAGRLATVAPESTLREVAELLAARHVGGAPVLAGSRVAGVVSATDLLGFAAAAPAEREEAQPWDAGPGEDDEDGPAAAVFLEAWMEAGMDLPDPFGEGGWPEWNGFDEHTAAEVMSRRIRAVHPDASLADAARAMLGAGVHRLLVIEDGQLVGLLSGTDLVRAVAEERLVPPTGTEAPVR